MRPALNHYHAFGLHIESLIELPGLAPISGHVNRENIVRIAYGTVPPELQDSRRFEDRVEVAGNAALIRVEGVAAYLLEGGIRVTIDPDIGSDSTRVRHFLYGLAFGVLFVQRRIFALHASGIEIDGAGVAFLGSSGSGKSTLAAYLNRKGHRLICDDACVVDTTPTGMQTRYGVSQLKLWRESLNAIETSTVPRQSVQPGLEKYFLPAAGPTTDPTCSVPLRALYVIEPVRPDAPIDIVPVTGLAALNLIRQHVHGRHLHCRINGDEHFLTRCIAIQRNLPLYSMRIPRGFQRLADAHRRLESHWETDTSRVKFA